jgi:GNAT superfamily N-acetyltransferase
VSGVTIRLATPDDSAIIAVLLDQLGYPASAEDIPQRLDAINGLPSVIAMVAEDPERGVVGLVTSHVFPSIHDNEQVAWLTTLVVLDEVRGEGVGSELVLFVEEWAAKRGAPRISVTSHRRRERTHQFYQQRGYEWTGLRFTKSLAAREPNVVRA